MTDDAKQPEIRILKVSGGTDCQKLASSIAGDVERGQEPVVEYIGAGACNQAVKAIAIANSHLAKTGVYLSFIPMFQRRKLKGNDNAVAMQLRAKIHSIA